MTALGRLWRFISAGAGQDARGGHGAGRNDTAALRLYSLPRGVRQRSKYGLLHV